MAASAELLLSALAPIPKPAGERVPALPDTPEATETMDLSAASDPDVGLDGSCSCGCTEAPLTSEPPLADVAPLTSEPPLAAELPLTSEPTGTALYTDLRSGMESLAG